MKLLTMRVAFATLVLLAGSALRAQTLTYDQLRQRWVDNITGGNFTPDATLNAKVAELDAAVATLRSQMVPGTPPASGYLFPEANEVAAVLGENQRHAHLTKTYENLAKMALALRTKGSAYEFVGGGSALAQATRDDIKRGLAWMVLNGYKDDSIHATPNNPKHNWWDLEIGCTGWLGNILCLLSTGPFLGGGNGGLDQTALDLYSKPMITKLTDQDLLKGTGANGAWRVRTWTLLGMIRQNRKADGAAKNYFVEAQGYLNTVLGLPPPTVHNWDSEGFHPDGTFLGHRILSYAGSYGAQMIDRLAELVEYYDGTSWPSNANVRTSLRTWIAASDGQMYHLQFFQNVMGRTLTRYRQKNFTSLGLCLSTIWVSRLVTGDDRADLHALVRHWLDSAGIVLLDESAGMTIPQYLRARDYVNNDQAGAAPMAVADDFRVFPYGGTAVARRPGWAASVNSFTNNTLGDTRPRIKTNEANNGDTPRGGFLGNGSLQVLTPDLDAFANGYYENLEWKRIPGTTVDIDLEPTGVYCLNTTNWAGGAGTDRFGVFGFELQPGDFLEPEYNIQSADLLGRFHARKGWFFFDKEIVALGSDIRRTDTSVTHKIHTNVDNRKLLANNANTFKLGSPGAAMVLGPTSEPGTSRAGTNRAWISGNTAPTSMGYYFPGSVSLNYTRAQRTTTPPPGAVTYNPVANYLMLWISHGIPSSGMYQYILLPGFTEAETDAFAAAQEVAATSPITILANSATAQAVRKVMPAPVSVEADETLDATGALFFTDTTTLLSLPAAQGGAFQLSSNRQGAVMVEETEARIIVSLADVTWQQTGYTTLQIGKKVSNWQEKDADSIVDGTYPTIQLRVAPGGAKGASQVFVFNKRYEFGSDDGGLFIDSSSNDAYVKYLTGQTGADGARIFSYNSDAVGDYITFKAWHQMTGSYKLVLRVKKSTNRGKMKVYLGTTNAPTTQVGSEIDLYSATDTFQTIEIPIAAFTTNGDRFIKFEVTGKNASSGGYRMVFDSLAFQPL